MHESNTNFFRGIFCATQRETCDWLLVNQKVIKVFDHGAFRTVTISPTTLRQNARQYDKTSKRKTVRQNGRESDPQWATEFDCRYRTRFVAVSLSRAFYRTAALSPVLSLSRLFCRSVVVSLNTVRQNGRERAMILSLCRPLLFFALSLVLSHCRGLDSDSTKCPILATIARTNSLSLSRPRAKRRESEKTAMFSAPESHCRYIACFVALLCVLSLCRAFWRYRSHPRQSAMSCDCAKFPMKIYTIEERQLVCTFKRFVDSILGRAFVWMWMLATMASKDFFNVFWGYLAPIGAVSVSYLALKLALSIFRGVKSTFLAKTLGLGVNWKKTGAWAGNNYEQTTFDFCT